MPQAQPPVQPPRFAPDDLDYQNAPGTRVHFTAHQRGADATALGTLALLLPGFLLSLLVVALVGLFLDAWLGLPYWVPPIAWAFSGALAFHRPTEDFLARYLLRLHRPMPHERARLEPVWREVTARAGVDGRQYELWIQDSQDLNAYAAAGHIVAVTRFALEQLPSTRLAAVLAHELGHHTGGHAWSSLLKYWYSLPGRAAWRVIRAVVVFAVAVTSYFSWAVTAALVCTVGIITLLTITVTFGLPLLLLAIPYLMAALGRRAELRADRHAAALGFAPMLAEVLYVMHTTELQARHQAAALGKPLARPGALARLLATHPDYPTRLQRLQPYLQPGR
ncbi:peptidase [Streptomyces albus subsp. albus]|nr:peptidase [Streptomyces albus subsp. albus]